MADTTYNGYTNYATWNVCLWLDNEYDLYHARVNRFKNEKATAETAEEFTRSIWAEGPPDFATEPKNTYDEVDWDEVAENFNAE